MPARFTSHCLYLYRSSRPTPRPAQPLIQWVQETLSLGVKWPGSEADHSPPSSTVVKNTVIYTSTPPIRLRGALLSRAQGQLCFYLYHMNHMSSPGQPFLDTLSFCKVRNRGYGLPVRYEHICI